MIVNQALFDLHGRPKLILQHKKSAELWFFSDDKNYIFSFLNICDFLEIPPEIIREGYTGREVERLVGG